MSQNPESPDQQIQVQTPGVHHIALRVRSFDQARHFYNTLGYELLQAQQVDDAVTIFEMNVAAYPRSANLHDSLADGPEAAGRLEDPLESTDQPMRGTGGGSPTYLEVEDATRISQAFAAMLDSVNARQPVPFVFNYAFDQAGENGYVCRTDAYSYVRYGIPAVELSRGGHLDYHQVTDEEQYIDYPDLARVAKLAHDFALALANAPTRPALDHAKPADPHAPCGQ